MRIDGDWIGQINLSRSEVRPFDSKQAAILQTFADQAAIAIRNAGLFNDLEEALQLQTATSEVLALISEHPGDLTRVLDRASSQGGRRSAAQRRARSRSERSRGHPLRGIARPGDGAVHRHHDATADPCDRALFEQSGRRRTRRRRLDDMIRSTSYPYFEEMAEQVNVRSYAVRPASTVDLDGVTVGGLHVFRQEVRPFDRRRTRRRWRHLRSRRRRRSANANLFNDLDAALERQTAMSDVLEAVGTARVDIQPVFEPDRRTRPPAVRRHHAAISVLDGDRMATQSTAGSLGFVETRAAEPCRRPAIDVRRPWRRDLDDGDRATNRRANPRPRLGTRHARRLLPELASPP